MRNAVASFVIGIIFALGLGVSGMTHPDKVLNFLDITGSWDGSLAFVMVGAIGVHFVLYRLIMRRKHPVLAAKFDIPTRRDIDARLVTGAAIFGIGWGLAGICPGPGFVSLASGVTLPALFIVSMLVGMYAFRLAHRLYTTRATENTKAVPLARGPVGSADSRRPVHS